MGFLRLRRPWGFSHEARRGPQGASRAAPGNSCLHAHGEGELVITLESWEVTRASRRVEEGLSRSFSGGGGKPSFPSTSAGDYRELTRVPPLEMRPSSIAPNPAESREALPTAQHPSPLRGTLGSSLRSPAEVEGNEGFPPQPEKDLESPSSTPLEDLAASHDSGVMTSSPSPCAWRPDFPGPAREAP